MSETKIIEKIKGNIITKYKLENTLNLEKALEEAIAKEKKNKNILNRIAYIVTKEKLSSSDVNMLFNLEEILRK